MKGKAIIELTDKNGKKTTHEHNMTTDVFKDVFTVVSNLSGGGTSSDIIRHYGSYMANLFKGFRDSNMYGIKLYENKIPEVKENYLNHSRVSVGYGNQGVDYDEKRGVLNVLSTCKLTNDNDEQIGVRLVWDFPTNTANGNIQSICLTTANTDLYTTLTSNFLNTGTQSFKDKGIFLRTERIDSSYTKEGLLLRVDNNKIMREKQKTGIVSPQGWVNNPEDFETYILEGYEDLYKVYDFHSYYLTIAKNTVTQVYDLLKLNRDSLEVLENTPLTALTSTYYDYGFVGEVDDITNIIFQNTFTSSNTTASYKNYNLKTHTVADLNPPNRYTNSVRQGANAITVNKDLDNKLYCRLLHYRLGHYSSSSTSRYYYPRQTVYKTNSEGNLEVMYSNTHDRSNASAIYVHFGIQPIGIASDNGVCEYNGANPEMYCYIALENQCLLTINNLDVPLVKTDAYTMKITYELTWGE